MISFDETHHAVFLKCSRESGREGLFEYFEKSGESVKGNPDIVFFDVAKFGIEEARALRDTASSRPLQSERKTIVAFFDYITEEAQNALLKSLEEPGSARFFLVSERDSFIPTLRSRIFTGDVAGEKERNSKYVFSPKESLADNLKVAEKIAADYKAGKVTKIEIETLLRRFAESLPKDFPSKERGEILSVIGYLHDTSSSVKMILESVAILAR